MYTLSKRFDNLSLWAKYAADHTGYCLEFANDGPLFSERVMEVIDGECALFDVIDSDNRSAEFLVDKRPEWSNEEEVRLLRGHGSGPMQASSSSSHQGVLGAPHLMSLWRREPLIWIGP